MKFCPFLRKIFGRFLRKTPQRNQKIGTYVSTYKLGCGQCRKSITDDYVCSTEPQHFYCRVCEKENKQKYILCNICRKGSLYSKTRLSITNTVDVPLCWQPLCWQITLFVLGFTPYQPCRKARDEPIWDIQIFFGKKIKKMIHFTRFGRFLRTVLT